MPQGGVISPLLANLYLNALDWAVNDPKQRGRPVMVRYADDFVILCAPGQGGELVERLEVVEIALESARASLATFMAQPPPSRPSLSEWLRIFLAARILRKMRQGGTSES